MPRYRSSAFALACLSMTAACAPMVAGGGGLPPVGGYVVSSIDGAPAPDGTTMQIGEDRRISGKGPCNNYSGQITEQNGALTIMGVAMTRRACLDPARSTGEARFSTALQSVTGYRNTADGITLTDPEGKQRIVLRSITD